MYYLFLDDIRVPTDVTWKNLPLFDWTIVRNYQEFVDIITKQGLPEFIAYDHDLADEHYGQYALTHDKFGNPIGTIEYEKFNEKTGMSCAKWLVDYCLDKKLDIPNYIIHSMNTVGSENIDSLLKSADKAIRNEK